MKNIVVIGMGYVGLPLLLALVKSRKKVFGYDIKSSIIDMLCKGECHLNLWQERFSKEIQPGENAFFVTNLNLIKKIDVAIICVPTPLNINDEPDHSFVDAAVKSLSELDVKPSLIILESTVAPGYTRSVAEKYFYSELSINKGNVHFCFSPEREDPGNENFSNVEIPKILSGLSQKCLTLGADLYMSVFNHIVKASSLEVAELCKLHENTFRAVNISYANQMRDLSAHLEVNFDEVVSLAKSKPFGFMPFNPGIGVGGHCIPVDPYYLLSKVSQSGVKMSIVEKAMIEIQNQPKKTYDWLVEKGILGKDVLLTGVAYKDGVSDIRCSPAIELFKMLKQDCKVNFWDKKVSQVEIDGVFFQSVSDDFFRKFCGVIVIVNEIGRKFVDDTKLSTTAVLDPRYKIEL